MKRAAAVVVAALLSFSAGASERTSMAFIDADLRREYSQGIRVEIVLRDKNGALLDGSTACGDNPCRVIVDLKRTDDVGEVVQLTVPDVAVGANGGTSARLTLVDGAHNGATFLSDDEGFDYTITARFRGVGAFPEPVPLATDADCQDGAAGVDDGRLCPSTATAALKVFPEVPSLSFNQDVDMAVADTVTLAATLTDSNGDADPAGEDLEGPGEKVLEGLPIRFFYDVDDDGRPSGDELLGEALTNAFGVAAFDFFADPAFVQAGVYDAGLHAEFPGDDRYSIARTAVRLTLQARGPQADKTIIEVEPGTLPANGTAEAIIRVRLVDPDNNLLGPDAPEHEVAITTTLGLLQNTVERQVLDGTYEQVIRVQRKGGTATIEVTVDGEDAGSAKLEIEGAEGCTCTSSSSSPALGLLALLALPVLLRRRRR
ncbi:MAG: Ig-like domain-containing protein [Deltaproteobacteria bacterium]|nr:Ig-like domain-containing protein [Deltaproteobacteria bacterium]